MKIPKIYTALAVVVATGGSYFISSSIHEEKTAAYIPREKKMTVRYAQNWNGAAEYYTSLRKNIYTGKVEVDDILRAREQVRLFSMQKSSSMNLQWVERGPDNVGGRTRAIVVDTNNSNHVLAGSVSGGLFVSYDAASTWAPVDDQFENLIVSSLTQDPDGNFWMGTGSDFDYSANAEGVLFPGNGLYKSTSGAKGTWTRVVGPALPNSSDSSNFITPTPQKYTVTVDDHVFNPPIVYAFVGDTIEWILTGDTSHTTTSLLPVSDPAYWNQTLSTPGETFKYVIKKAGAIKYKCSQHIGIGMVAYIHASNDTVISKTKEWTTINRIAFKPGNSSEIYCATNMGLRVSNNGGATWINPIFEDYSACSGYLQIKRVEDLDVTSDGRLFLSLDGIIYYSDNPMDCSTYIKVQTSIVPQGKRTEIAIAPSNPNYVYACLVEGNGHFQAVYKSTDKGVTWSQLLFPIPDYFTPMTSEPTPYGQGVYDLAFAVAPNNPDKIFIGGVELWVYDGNLTRVAQEFGFPPYYVHSDKHLFHFDPNNPSILYVGTDGGIFKSFNATNDQQDILFFSANKGYNVTQFYAGAFGNPASANSPAIVLGGSQDNGTQLMAGTSPSPLKGEQVIGGDGFDCDISSITGAMFGTIYSNNVQRSSAAGGGFSTISGNYINEGIFNTVVRLWESKTDVTSHASIVFKVDTTKQGIGTGNGTKKVFTGTLTPSQASAKLKIGSLRILAGGVNFNDWQNTSNSTSTFSSGSNTCAINYSTGAYTLTFINAPTVNTPVWAYYTTYYNAGSLLKLQSNTAGVEVPYTISQSMNYGDSIIVQDPIQSILAISAIPSQGGVAFTRSALDFNATVDTTWIRAGSTTMGTASCIEFSRDGNHMFVGTGSNGVWRISGLNNVYDSIDAVYSCNLTRTKILSTSSTVTGISVDWDNPRNVVVTLGNYGSSGHVYRSSEALSDSVETINLTKGGSGFTSAPGVVFSGGGGGLNAMAVATLSGDSVTGINVISGGIGYSSAPTVSFYGGGGASATANRNISKISVKTEGSAYTSTPTVAIAGGGGTGAAAIACRKIKTLILTNQGSGYTGLPTVTFSPPDPSCYSATAKVDTAGGKVTNIILTCTNCAVLGGGYTSTPTVSISGGGGTGATAIAVLDSSITSYKITTSGDGYTSEPTVTVTGGGGTGATATAELSKNISSITVNSGGSGYTSAPTIIVSGGCGSGATATATVSGGTITNINVNNGGSNYISMPTISFKGGGNTGTAALAATATVNDITFTDVSGDLPDMPVYDAEFINHTSKVILGTEFGIYATNDIFASSVQWTDENNGAFPHMPVFEVRQQKFWPSNNYEMLYITTHGRGMWQSGSFLTGIKDPPSEIAKGKFLSDLSVYPNPFNGEGGMLVFNIQSATSGNIRMYDLNGRNIKSMLKQSFNTGTNRVKLDAENLSNGTYFVTVEAGDVSSVAKFVVIR